MKDLSSNEIENNTSIDMNNVSVVISARNEALNLPHVLPRIPKEVFEVILVDGHSSDNTVDVAKELLPSIRILFQPNKGKGDAIIHGFNATKGEIVIAIDADGSMAPEELPQYVKYLVQDYDVCKGSRFLKCGGTEDMPPIRIIGNWFFTTLTNALYGSRFTDLAYGYFGLRREVWSFIKPSSKGFAIETEIAVKAQKAHLRIIEVPSFEHKRIHGEGKLKSFEDGRSILWTIIKERFSN